jgi:hypothetical protein
MEIKKWVPWNWFKNGVLKLTIPRVTLPDENVQRIPVETAISG